MEDALVIVITLFVVGLIESYFLQMQRRNNKEQQKHVALPKFYFYFGTFFLLFSVFPLFGIWSAQQTIFYDPLSYFFIGMDCLVIAMCVSQVNWRIVPLENEMIYRNLLRREKNISYGNIKQIKHLKTGDTLILLEGKLFPIVIDKFAIGMEELIASYNRYQFRNRKK